MENSDGILYYWCINCGNTGKFSFRRTSQCKCETCSYDALTPYELEEIMQDEHLQLKFKETLDANTPVAGS